MKRNVIRKGLGTFKKLQIKFFLDPLEFIYWETLDISLLNLLVRDYKLLFTLVKFYLYSEQNLVCNNKTEIKIETKWKFQVKSGLVTLISVLIFFNSFSFQIKFYLYLCVLYLVSN